MMAKFSQKRKRALSKRERKLKFERWCFLLREFHKPADYAHLPPNEREKMELLDIAIGTSTGMDDLLAVMEQVGITRVYFNFAPQEDHHNAWQVGINCPSTDQLKPQLVCSKAQQYYANSK